MSVTGGFASAFVLFCVCQMTFEHRASTKALMSISRSFREVQIWVSLTSQQTLMSSCFSQTHICQLLSPRCQIEPRKDSHSNASFKSFIFIWQTRLVSLLALLKKIKNRSRSASNYCCHYQLINLIVADQQSKTQKEEIQFTDTTTRKVTNPQSLKL